MAPVRQKNRKEGIEQKPKSKQPLTYRQGDERIKVRVRNPEKSEQKERNEQKKGLGEWYHAYDDGTTRITLEGFIAIKKVWEIAQLFAETNRSPNTNISLESFPVWVKEIPGLLEVLEPLTQNKHIDADTLAAILQQEEFTTEQLYFEFQNHTFLEEHPDKPPLFDESELEHFGSRDPKQITNTVQSGGSKKTKNKNNTRRRRTESNTSNEEQSQVSEEIALEQEQQEQDGELYERDKDGKTRLTEEGLEAICADMHATYKALRESVSLQAENLDVAWAKEVADTHTVIADTVQEVKTNFYFNPDKLLADLQARDCVRPEVVQQWYEAQETVENKKERLRNALDRLFSHISTGVSLAKDTEDNFSGNGASLYTLISFEGKERGNIPQLMKVGWGDFSRETFEKNKNPLFNFKDFPIDLYCVSQRKSFFADKEVLRQMKVDPRSYLTEYSLFAANKGVVQVAEKMDRGRQHLDREIQPIRYEEALGSIRDQIVKDKILPKLGITLDEFAEMLQNIPDTYDAVKTYLQEHETDKESAEHAGIQQLIHMGFPPYTDSGKSTGRLLELKRAFNFKTNSFVP